MQDRTPKSFYEKYIQEQNDLLAIQEETEARLTVMQSVIERLNRQHSAYQKGERRLTGFPSGLTYLDELRDAVKDNFDLLSRIGSELESSHKRFELAWWSPSAVSMSGMPTVCWNFNGLTFEKAGYVLLSTRALVLDGDTSKYAEKGEHRSYRPYSERASGFSNREDRRIGHRFPFSKSHRHVPEPGSFRKPSSPLASNCSSLPDEFDGDLWGKADIGRWRQGAGRSKEWRCWPCTAKATPNRGQASRNGQKRKNLPSQTVQLRVSRQLRVPLNFSRRWPKPDPFPTARSKPIARSSRKQRDWLYDDQQYDLEDLEIEQYSYK